MAGEREYRENETTYLALTDEHERFDLLYRF